jgi:hypothetical protein
MLADRTGLLALLALFAAVLVAIWILEDFGGAAAEPRPARAGAIGDPARAPR